MKKVSVLIPAYNVEKYIDQCLESVCNQSYRNLEIVIINDGSTDTTPQLIKAWADKDSRIIYKSRGNKGVAATRNELIDTATGDYICFVDSDDWVEADYVLSLVKLIEKSNADLAMSGNTDENIISQSKGSNEMLINKEETIDKFLIHRDFTGSLWNKLIKADLYKQTRFDNSVGYGEDAMVIWDIINNISRAVITDKKLYHYRKNLNSISSKKLSETKLSVKKVWRHIIYSNKCISKRHKRMAKERYGAEICLLLLEAAKSGVSSSNNFVSTLRTELKYVYPYILKSSNLSARFKLFSIMAAKCWRMTLRVIN